MMPVLTQIIDGDSSFAAKLKEDLEQIGHRVSGVATSWEDCLAQPEIQQADVLLIGHRPTGPTTGLKTIELAMEKFQAAVVSIARLRPETVTLFASGYSENVIVHHGLVGEGIAFVAKPYAPQTLTKKVRDVLDGRPH